MACSADDRPNQTDIGTEHWVKPQIEWIKNAEAVTLQLKAQGWEYKFFQGRHAMARMVCVPCIRKSKEAADAMRHYRKLAKAAEQGEQDNYYAALCQ